MPPTHGTPPEEGHGEAAQHVAEAHQLLKALRQRLDQHPELEEAIRKLESALNILTVKTAGML